MSLKGPLYAGFFVPVDKLQFFGKTHFFRWVINTPPTQKGTFLLKLLILLRFI